MQGICHSGGVATDPHGEGGVLIVENVDPQRVHREEQAGSGGQRHCATDSRTSQTAEEKEHIEAKVNSKWK